MSARIMRQARAQQEELDAEELQQQAAAPALVSKRHSVCVCVFGLNPTTQISCPALLLLLCSQQVLTVFFSAAGAMLLHSPHDSCHRNSGV